MLKHLTPTTARLVVETPTDFVYCIPKIVLSDAVRSNGYQARSFKNKDTHSVLKDLSTGDMFLLSQEDLPPFAVPDEQLGHFMHVFDIRGIATPYKMRPVNIGTRIPLHGNTTNPEWASINLGGSCNSHCSFCYTDWLRNVPDLSTSQAREVIDQIAAIGTVRILVFSGGEATIRKDLVSLMEYANQLGFPEIALQTNGRELRKVDLVEKLFELGLRRVLLSLHGPNSRIHDAITGSPGSFVEALEGIRNLRKLTIEPTVNIVMCRENYKHLSDIVVLLREVCGGVGTLRFSYPIIEGAAFDNLNSVIVSFSQLQLLMRDAMRLAEESGFEVQAANMPLCIPNNGHRNTTYDTMALSKFVEASPFYEFNIPRGEKSAKLTSCRDCRLNDACRGIQIEYLRTCPDPTLEFNPII